jgi:hypothetical protein
VASNPIALPSSINSTTRRPDLAKKMGVYQSWVTHMESGQRRIDAIELIELGKAIGLTPRTSCASLSRR